MARPELQALYEELLLNQFGFMPRGTHSLDEIYQRVHATFTHQCDNNYLCSQNCSHGHDQPEWKHAVRRALQQMKSNTGAVRHASRGLWSFH